MGFFRRIFGIGNQPGTDPQPLSRGDAIVYAGDTPLEVKGASYYQEALKRVAGQRTREGYDLPVVAVLQPEPSNPYDGNAVEVLVSGLKVGYVNRQDAARLHRRIVALESRTGRAVALEGRIVGGWSRDSDEGNFGVRLRYDPSHF